MEVCFLSGQRVAVLEAAEFEGKTTKAVKQALAPKIGVTRFRQRLFLEGDAVEIPDDNVFTSVPEKLQLVVLEFCPPDVAEDEQMMVAARGNDTVGLEQLLKRPQNPNTRDECMTPLHHAAEHGHVEPMRLLLEAGAEIDAQREEEEMAPLHNAAHMGHLEAVRFLVQNGAQKDLTDIYGSTSLLLAVEHNFVDIARFLVAEGADKEQLLNCGSTLSRAAEYGELDMVRFLVEIGCDKDKTDNFGKTALHRAAAEGHVDVVRVLVESGADRHLLDISEKTALDVASENRHADIVGFLSHFEAESHRKVRRLNTPERWRWWNNMCWELRGFWHYSWVDGNWNRYLQSNSSSGRWIKLNQTLPSCWWQPLLSSNNTLRVSAMSPNLLLNLALVEQFQEPHLVDDPWGLCYQHQHGLSSPVSESTKPCDWRFSNNNAGWNSGPLGRASQIFNFHGVSIQIPCWVPIVILIWCVKPLMFSLMNRLLLKQIWPSIDMEIPPCVHRFAIGFSTSMLLCWRVTTTQVLLCTQHLQVFLASPGSKYTIDPIKRLSNFLMMRLRSDARSA